MNHNQINSYNETSLKGELGVAATLNFFRQQPNVMSVREITDRTEQRERGDLEVRFRDRDPIALEIKTDFDALLRPQLQRTTLSRTPRS